MAKIATLAFDNDTNKWTAKYNGQIVAASHSKSYVIENIETGRCNKANKLGVTGVQEVEGSMVLSGAVSHAPVEQAEDKFTINERFEFMDKYVSMVAKRTAPSVIISGEGGLGKTFTVLKSLQKAGLKNATFDANTGEIGMITDNSVTEKESKKLFSVIKGYSTAKGLYRTLWENRNRTLVFDDCDSVLRDPVSLNLLKGALDSYERRIISWNAESFGDDDLPKSFEFKGGVIFISNLPMYKIDGAVKSRAMCVDLSMSTDQKIERMREIIKSEEFLPDVEMKIKEKAMEFLAEKKDIARELSFRTLISVTKIAVDGGKWEGPAEYILLSA